MGAFCVVELQRLGKRVEHVVGHTSEVAALESGVVVDAHAGQQGDLLAAQPRCRHTPEALLVGE